MAITDGLCASTFQVTASPLLLPWPWAWLVAVGDRALLFILFKNGAGSLASLILFLGSCNGIEIDIINPSNYSLFNHAYPYVAGGMDGAGQTTYFSRAMLVYAKERRRNLIAVGLYIVTFIFLAYGR
jgi:hypothetical protein